MPDRTLAGSTLTMDPAQRSLVDPGRAISDASRRVSSHRADFLGLTEGGRLQPGAWGALRALDAALRLRQTGAEHTPVAWASAAGSRPLCWPACLTHGRLIACLMPRHTPHPPATAPPPTATRARSWPNCSACCPPAAACWRLPRAPASTPRFAQPACPVGPGSPPTPTPRRWCRSPPGPPSSRLPACCRPGSLMCWPSPGGSTGPHPPISPHPPQPLRQWRPPLPLQSGTPCSAPTCCTLRPGPAVAR